MVYNTQQHSFKNFGEVVKITFYKYVVLVQTEYKYVVLIRADVRVKFVHSVIVVVFCVCVCMVHTLLQVCTD